MQSDVKKVDQYLDEVPKERKEALARLRQLCQNTLTGYEESMEYGMPSYKVPGKEVEVAFASQKNYMSLYILKEAVLNEFRPALAGLNLGKGCVRYTRPEKMDFSVIEQLLAASRDSDSPIC
jgi:uncharacterized protein YdhG (YjbR/CyaY superfamily)